MSSQQRHDIQCIEQEFSVCFPNLDSLNDYHHFVPSKSCKETEQCIHNCTLCSRGARQATSRDTKEVLKTRTTRDVRWLELFTQQQSQLHFPLHLGPPPMYAFTLFLEVHIATSKQYKTAISPENSTRKKALETIFSYVLRMHWQQTSFLSVLQDAEALK